MKYNRSSGRCGRLTLAQYEGVKECLELFVDRDKTYQNVTLVPLALTSRRMQGLWRSALK